MKHTVELSPELQELAEKTERDIVRLSEHLLDVTDRLEQLGSAFQKTADEAVRARLYSTVAMVVLIGIFGIRR